MAERQQSTRRRGGTFDALDVALRGASFSGTMDAAALPRVIDVLAPDSGSAEVAWRIAGVVDAMARPALEISLDGAVPLVCQRCLRPFSWPVAQQTTVLLARDERELAHLDAEDEHEVMLAAAPVDMVTLTEDELLLALPFAPRCERAECTAAAIAGAGTQEETESPSAFAALAELKKGSAKKGKN